MECNTEIFYHTLQDRETTIGAIGDHLKAFGTITAKTYSLQLETGSGTVVLDLKSNEENWCEDDEQIVFPYDYDKFRWVINFWSHDDTFPEDFFKQVIEAILSFFWEQGIPACDTAYDGEGLLHNGGVESTEVPWPNQHHERPNEHVEH